MLLLIPWTIINIIDVVMIFLLSHAIVKKKPVLTVKKVLIGVAYALILGIVTTVFESGYIHRIVATVLALLIIYLIMKKPFSSVVLGYAIFWAIVFIQLPFGIIFQSIGIEGVALFSIIQILTLITVIILCRFFPFNNFFRFLEEHLVLKLVFFILAFICLAAAFYFNFEYNMPLLIFWTGMLAIMLIAICKISSRVIYLKHTIPLRQNDAYHTILGLLIKAYQENDVTQIEALKKELEANHDVYFELDGFQMGKTTENIIAFIESRRADIKTEIKYDIRYRQEHSRVSIDVIIKLLSILLDNAIESKTNKPIVIDLGVSSNHIQLSVRNEFKLTDPEGINRILMIDGYTTKKVKQRGYGLTNLHLELKQISGEMTTSYSYNQDGKAYYLNMMINIIG